MTISSIPNNYMIYINTTGSYKFTAVNGGNMYLYVGAHGTMGNLPYTYSINAGQYIKIYGYPNAQTYTSNNTRLNITRIS